MNDLLELARSEASPEERALAADVEVTPCNMVELVDAVVVVATAKLPTNTKKIRKESLIK